ncbi:ribosome biogenesis GTPase Der [Ahniella affigens]|uniref:GTPase Der n=1 Tax=Ahniella affigens TaxID=2021234 RepID=A0A2P1PTL8_9GAMM|nr:ribosome biogenesis GTPase Der [Ahniella affigens]AVP98183.1 ribosome biogenesis GTPase Der [Ahniella affigens]
MLPVVALVGRPNVGKSTLFNVLTSSRDALVADRPGVTRDRQYGVCRNVDRPYVVVDTGGLTDSRDFLARATVKQAVSAIDEAQLVLFIVDAKEGLLVDDHDVLQQIRRSGKPCILVLNKIDASTEAAAGAEFAALGMSAVLAVSAAHKRGIDALQAEIRSRLPEPEGSDQDAGIQDLKKHPGIRLAIIGRPNVGKSTLVNRLLGEDRVIASEVPGTTRDAIAIPLHRDGQDWVLIDTAGVRRKSKVEDVVEKFSVIKTLQTLDQCDVAILMLDAQEGVTEQDASVLGYALDAGRALVIALNKWDGLSPYQRERSQSELDRRLDFVPWAERITISAKHGSGLGELTDAAIAAYRSANTEIPSSELTRGLEAALTAYQPPLVGGRAPKMRYAHLGGTKPPRIVIHGSRLNHVADSYVRYLENFFRKRYKMVGTPVAIELRNGDNPFAGRKNELTEKQAHRRRRMIQHHKRGK